MEPGHGGRLVRCLRAAELGPLPPPADRARRISTATATPLLSVRDLHCTYPRVGRVAVESLSFEVHAGETVCLVGESGSGKSTTLRAIAGLHPAFTGAIEFEGAPLPARVARRDVAVLRAIQMVFQNPDSSLNPRHRVATLLERPLSVFRPELDRRARSAEMQRLVAAVQLDASVLRRVPSELSGGQKQRIALARAFAGNPKLLLCDEVVSALDVSVQAVVLELIAELSRSRGVAVLFVTHDLGVVRALADQVLVLKDGHLCEEGVADEVLGHPRDPYTRSLVEAVPRCPQRVLEPANQRGVTWTG